MKKFLVRLLIFAIVFFIIDKVFILVRNRLPSLEVDKRLEKLINGEINADVYIMGSSRGCRNIIPLQIEEAIHKSVYNISYLGSNIDFQEYLLTEMLRANKPPDQIILAVDDYNGLIEHSSLKFRYDRLYPLISYPKISNTLIERGEKNWLLSKVLILHQLNRSNLYLAPKSFTKIDSIFEKGSMTVSFMSPTFDKKFNDEIDINSYNINEESDSLRAKFLSFVNICDQNNIDLILCFSPNFKNNNVSFEKRIKELTGERARYMHFDKKNPEYRNPENYTDESHLQKKGAKIFTDDLILFLKRDGGRGTDGTRDW